MLIVVKKTCGGNDKPFFIIFYESVTGMKIFRPFKLIYCSMGRSLTLFSALERFLLFREGGHLV